MLSFLHSRRSRYDHSQENASSSHNERMNEASNRDVPAPKASNGAEVISQNEKGKAREKPLTATKARDTVPLAEETPQHHGTGESNGDDFIPRCVHEADSLTAQWPGITAFTSNVAVKLDRRIPFKAPLQHRRFRLNLPTLREARPSDIDHRLRRPQRHAPSTLPLEQEVPRRGLLGPRQYHDLPLKRPVDAILPQPQQRIQSTTSQLPSSSVPK